MSVTAGLVSGRWWSVALAVLVVPVAAITFSDDYGGDSVSGPFDAALFAATFVALPLAASIAIGVGIRHLVRGRRGRAQAASL